MASYSALPPANWSLTSTADQQISQPWYTYMRGRDQQASLLEKQFSYTDYTSADGAQTFEGIGTYRFDLAATTITHTIGPPIPGYTVRICASGASTGIRITTTSTGIIFASSSTPQGWFLNFPSTTMTRRWVTLLGGYALGTTVLAYFIVHNDGGATATTT